MISRDDFYFLCLMSRKLYLLCLFKLLVLNYLLCTFTCFLFRSCTPLLEYLITSIHGPLIKKSWNLRVAWDWEQEGRMVPLDTFLSLLFQILYVKMNSFLGLLASTMILTGTPHFCPSRFMLSDIVANK